MVYTSTGDLEALEDDLTKKPKTKDEKIMAKIKVGDIPEELRLRTPGEEKEKEESFGGLVSVGSGTLTGVTA